MADDILEGASMPVPAVNAVSLNAVRPFDVQQKYNEAKQRYEQGKILLKEVDDAQHALNEEMNQKRQVLGRTLVRLEGVLEILKEQGAKDLEEEKT
jgi:hypothetical protein